MRGLIGIGVLFMLGIVLSTTACNTVPPRTDDSELSIVEEASIAQNDVTQAVGDERVALDEQRDLIVANAAAQAVCLATDCPDKTVDPNVRLTCGSQSTFVACGGTFCGAGCQNTPHCTTRCFCSRRPAQHYQAVTGCTFVLSTGQTGSCLLVATQTVQQNSCGCGGIEEC